MFKLTGSVFIVNVVTYKLEEKGTLLFQFIIISCPLRRMSNCHSVTFDDLIDFLVKWYQLLMEGTSIGLSLCLTHVKETCWQPVTVAPWLIHYHHNHFGSFIKTNGNLCWKWFPDSMYLITLVRTVPYSICILWGGFVSADGSPLSAMRTKAVLEIKTSSSDFRIFYFPKHEVYHIPTQAPCCLVWHF